MHIVKLWRVISLCVYIWGCNHGLSMFCATDLLISSRMSALSCSSYFISMESAVMAFCRFMRLFLRLVFYLSANNCLFFRYCVFSYKSLQFLLSLFNYCTVAVLLRLILLIALLSSLQSVTASYIPSHSLPDLIFSSFLELVYFSS